jgi:polysaccharide pyruvyl transferase CsaB
VARVLLMGYFGAGNFGDDALLADWLLRRREWIRANDIKVDVITNGGDALGRFVEGEALAGLIGNWIPKDAAMRVQPREYAALIAPGGSLLQDVTSLNSLLYYLWMVRRFISRRSRVFLLNQGIGPLNSWLASFVTPRALSRVTMLSLRDSQSHLWAQGRPQLTRHPALKLSADPVLSSVFEEVDFRAHLDLSGDYVVVIAKPTGDLPTPQDPVSEAEALGRLVNHSMRTTGLKHYLLALQPGADTEFCNKAAQSAGREVRVLALDSLTHPGSYCHSIIKSARLTISYRLHGLVAAAAGSGLAFGVAYDPKVAALCAELALPYCFPATVHEEQALADLARYWRERDEAEGITKAKVAECEARHRSSEELFDELWG